MNFLIHRSLFRLSKTPPQGLNPFEKPSFSKISNRSLIIAEGPEIRKFLQAYMTNDINLLFSSEQKQISRVSLYTLFLNSQGKIIADAFIFRPLKEIKGLMTPANNEVWIDVDRKVNTMLYEHLRKNSMRKSVQFVNLLHEDLKPDINVGFNNVVRNSFGEKEEEQIQNQGYNEGSIIEIERGDENQNSTTEEEAYANMAFVDPRNFKFGIRMISGGEGFNFKGTAEVSKQSEYEEYCRLNGTASSSIMVGKLPFMFNTDFFNAFSFTKGNYLGKDVLMKAYREGIVKRRIFPFIIEDGEVELPINEILYSDEGEEIGKVVESGKGFGIVLCNYLNFAKKEFPLKVASPHKGHIHLPFKKELMKYLEDFGYFKNTENQE